MKTDRIDNETAKAYAAFRDYCEMGEKRSIRSVARKLSKSATLIRRWSGRHHWTTRARQWDADSEARRRAAEDEALKREAHEWARRQRGVREKDYQTAQALREKAAEMLKYPLATKSVTADGKTNTFKPGRWGMGDAIKALQIASQLERLSCGMATEKTELSGPDNAPLQVSATPVVIVLPDNGRDKNG